MILPIRDNAPTYEFPAANVSLIVICLLVFVWQLTYPGGLVASREAWGEVPTRILAGGTVPGTSVPAWVTMFTSMWMHADFGHIFGNMYALWLFGDNVEWIMGRWRYLTFYVLCGLFASVVTTLLGYQSDMAGLGASGAIAGVMAAYLLTYPRARITSFMFIMPFSWLHAFTGTVGFTTRNISALWWIGSYLVFQVLYVGVAVGQGMWLNLGIYAHVSGALAGAGLLFVLRLKDRIPDPDHHTQSSMLTSAVVGDEGDGGVGTQPVMTISAEADRLRRLQARRPRLPEPEFSDWQVDEMVVRGDYSAAICHCQDMLEIARLQDNTHRSQGYSRLLARLEREAASTRPLEIQQQRDIGSRTPAPVQEAEADEDGGTQRGFNLIEPGGVQRGTRRRRGRRKIENPFLAGDED